jgi:hypothetical protein
MTLQPRYSVEIMIGLFFGVEQWRDITPYVEWDRRLEITSGRRDTASDPTPSRLTCTLDNTDGRFTPGLASGAYYPGIVDGAPVRCRIQRPSTVNLLDNGGHEQGIGEWAGGSFAGVGSPPALAQSATHVRSESWALGITWVNQGVESDAERTIYGLTIGQTYTYSEYLYVPTGSPNARMQVAGTGMGLGTTGSYMSTKDAYTRAEVTFTATWTSASIQIQVASSAGGGTCWADDGQLEEGSSATALAAPAERISRYFGYLSELPGGWPGSGTWALVDLRAVDLSERIGQRAGQLRPFDIEEALLDAPLVLLPLADPSGSTQAANLGSQAAVGAIANRGGSGAYEFGSGTGPPADGQSALVLTPAAGSGYYLKVANLGLFSAALTAEVWITTTVDAATLLDVDNSPTGAPAPSGSLSIVAGKLRWSTAIDSTAGTINSVNNVTDGLLHHCVATYVQNGTNHISRLYVDGVQVATTSVANTWALFVTEYALIGGSKNGVFTGTLSHAAVYPTALSADRVLAHYQAGTTGFGGERSDQRISRLAAYARLESLTPAYTSGVWVLDSATLSILDSTTILASADVELEVGSATVYGQSSGGSDYMSEMRRVAATEGGVLLVDTEGRLDFQARAHRYNAAPVLTVPAEYMATDLVPKYDGQYVVNQVTATTEDDVSATVADAASIAQRGYYSDTLALLTRDLDDAQAAAGWRVAQNADNRIRYTQVRFDLATLPDDVISALLRLGVGDRIAITGLPPQAPSATETLFVEGITESTSEQSWTLVFDTSPGDVWQVWVLDSPTYSVLDSTTSLAY